MPRQLKHPLVRTVAAPVVPAAPSVETVVRAFEQLDPAQRWQARRRIADLYIVKTELPLNEWRIKRFTRAL